MDSTLSHRSTALAPSLRSPSAANKTASYRLPRGRGPVLGDRPSPRHLEGCVLFGTNHKTCVHDVTAPVPALPSAGAR
eukprot:5428064-Alexandrium_andersonii.AAC.1